LISEQRAAEARALIEYHTRSISKEDVTPSEGSPNPGLRKFAQRRQTNTLTPLEKLDLVAEARQKTTELKRADLVSLRKKDSERKNRVDDFKSSATSKYRQDFSPKESAEPSEPSPTPGLRKFVSMKRNVASNAP
jgi:hypothetical protein